MAAGARQRIGDGLLAQAAGVAFVRVGSAFSRAARKAGDSSAGGPSSSMGRGTALMTPA